MSSPAESPPLSRLRKKLRERPMRKDLGPVRSRANRLIQSHVPDVVQVVGSNGKGSVVHYLAALLLESERTVVTYTSPHMNDVTERISLNGEPLRSDELEALLLSFDGDLIEEYTPFEGLFLCALQLAVNETADALILEAGMGGRWDATSALDPEWVILTSLDLEHTQHLGSTKKKILREKLAQLPEGGALLTGSIDDPESQTALNNLVQKKHLTRIGIETDTPADPMNRQLALAAARLLTGVPAGTLEEELTAVEAPPGRQEIRSLRGRRIIYDVAHTPRAVDSLLETIRSDFPETDRYLLYGSLEGKQTNSIVPKLTDAFGFERTILTKPGSPRARAPKSLLEDWPESEDHPRIEPNPDTAFHDLLEESQPDDLLVVAGSFHLVGTIRSKWHD